MSIASDQPGDLPGRFDLSAAVTLVVERDHECRSAAEDLASSASPSAMRARVPGTMEYLAGVSRRADADRVVAMLVMYRQRLNEHVDDSTSSEDAEVTARSIRLDIAVATQQSEWTVSHTLLTAGRAQHDLPLTWDRFTAGRMPWRNLDIAVSESTGLDLDRLPAYDEVAARRAEAELPRELGRHLRDERARLQADTAVERAKRATARRHVAVEPLPDGQASLSLIGPAHEVAAIDDALTKMAIHAVGADEARSVASAMYDGAVDILVTALRQGAPDLEVGDDPLETAAAGDAGMPATRLTEFGRVRVPHRVAVEPQILLTIPQSVATGTENESGGTAVLAGYGPIDPATARGLAGWSKSWTRVLTDPITGGLVDIDPKSRRISKSLARWLRARDEHCTAPGCGRVHCDIDHTDPFGLDGPTAPDNLALLCRTSHQVKHGGFWDMRQQADGTLRWESIWGTVWISQPATKVSAAATVRIRTARALDADEVD